MDTFVESPGRRSRRRHSPEFKASIIEACRRPGVSMASVALANGLNANMLRKWVIEAEQRDAGIGAGVCASAQAPAASEMPAFLPLQLPQADPPSDIRIELHRGSTRITMTWPTRAAEQCAAWLRELLR